jgi:hypothetical protein
MQNANTCDSPQTVYTFRYAQKKTLSRNSEPVRRNSNNRFEAQSVKYGAFPDGTNVVTKILHSTHCTNVCSNCWLLEVGFWLVHELNKRSTVVFQAWDEDFYDLRRVQTGCVAHKAHRLISTVGALPWDNAGGDWSWPLASIYYRVKVRMSSQIHTPITPITI